MWLYVTVLFSVLLLPSQVTEANVTYQDRQEVSVNETDSVNSDSVVSAVPAFKNSHSQEDENGVEIIKSVELDSSSVDFLMNMSGNDVSWVDMEPVSGEHDYKNENHVMDYSLSDITEFEHEGKEPEPFTASASEDAPTSAVSDQIVDKDFPYDFDFQSRILIGNLLLRDNNKTTYLSPGTNSSQKLNIKENDKFSEAEMLPRNQENDHEPSLKLANRKKKKSRPFNHWDFGRRTKPPKNLTKEQLLFRKAPQPDIIIPFKSEEEFHQYSPLQQLQNTQMYVRNNVASNFEYIPYVQQNNLQSHQVPTTNSEPHSVRDTHVYPMTNEQQILLRHSQPFGTNQEEENYSRSAGYTPQTFFVARYVPGYKIIPQPVILNTQEHPTTPPVYVSTQPSLQHYPLIISQSSQTPVPIQTTE